MFYTNIISTVRAAVVTRLIPSLLSSVHSFMKKYPPATSKKDNVGCVDSETGANDVPCFVFECSTSDSEGITLNHITLNHIPPTYLTDMNATLELFPPNKLPLDCSTTKDGNVALVWITIDGGFEDCFIVDYSVDKDGNVTLENVPLERIPAKHIATEHFANEDDYSPTLQ